MHHLLLLVLSVVSSACGYHILCVHTIHSRSHFNLVYGVVKPLLKAGHQVTFITSFPDTQAHQNLSIIDVSSTQKYMEALHSKNHSVEWEPVKQFARDVNREVFNKPAVRELLLHGKIDLVVTEWFFSDLEAGYSAIVQAPWIVVSGMIYHTRLEYLMDSVRSVPIIPTGLGRTRDYQLPLDFRHRLLNTFSFLFYIYDWIKDYPIDKAQYEEHFQPLARQKGITLAPFSEAIHNISLVFVNSHTTLAPAMSLPPNVIDIGGYYIDEEVPPLPQDLQELMDSSTEGVIYFSMGSVVKSTNFPPYTLQDILKLFSEIPQTVLWKFDIPLENLPKNVHVRPWMPQTSILSHPNLRVFITHCGLLSTLEALKFGAPILAVPVFGDQPSNAEMVEAAGNGLRIHSSPEMGKDLVEPLKRMLSNDSYYNRAKYLSRIFNNRPVTPTQLILHYVHLVIESQGAPHLRSKVHLYKWYQIWMIDQLAFFVLVTYVTYRILRKILCLISLVFSEKQKIL
ncbi:UDP-glucosyltransferase 2-like [Aricia agestis]|uniref:UDP-glucosyltransferase 2-like n=1 Tax=Aricia agestis TaxID=91739 RepID=UPI001C205526|nr:UDP-glucosyltransferase 2-like [Aricia agestis]XP_041988985.1 UDP-glucosyltransferase 2-like [Aricia agestis]XP_041988986.1 UDP-glucosyltransferase 2-like [Aricia agestis]XP_041988987.1 UDP-glucosyltransferase 2-like [Aricia agestis]